MQSKNSLKLVVKIQKSPVELFNQDYRYFVFNIKSLFTNVPLGKTITVILHRVHKEKLIDAKN